MKIKQKSKSLKDFQNLQTPTPQLKHIKGGLEIAIEKLEVVL